MKPFVGFTRTVSFLAAANAGVCAPPPHHVKIKLIKSRLARLPSPIFVETGTYLGDTIAALNVHCSRIVSVEVDPALCSNAQHRFRRSAHISIVGGDCLEVFPEILAGLEGPAVFWLDAHYSGGITGRGKVDDPILFSLDQLKTQHIRNNTILIDDARTFDGCDSRPNLTDVMDSLKGINPNYRLSVLYDVIIAEI